MTSHPDTYISQYPHWESRSRSQPQKHTQQETKQKKHTRILNEHTYTQANTLIQKHKLTQLTTRPHIYTKLTPQK